MSAVERIQIAIRTPYPPAGKGHSELATDRDHPVGGNTGGGWRPPTPPSAPGNAESDDPESEPDPRDPDGQERRTRSGHQEGHPEQPMWILLQASPNVSQSEMLFIANGVRYSGYFACVCPHHRIRIWIRVARIKQASQQTLQALIDLQSSSAFSRWTYDSEAGGDLVLEASACSVTSHDHMAGIRNALARDLLGILQDHRLSVCLARAQADHCATPHVSWREDE